MITPRRIQLRRTKGFDLQAVSRTLNGLPARSVSRPSPYGNYAGDTREAFEKDLREMSEADRATMFEKARLLRGYNLACWCGLNRKCHADVWLEMAKSDAPPRAKK